MDVHASAVSLLLVLGFASSASGATPYPYFERLCAGSAIHRSAAAAESELRALIATLRSGDEDARSVAADRVACHGAAAEEAVPLMIELFAARNGEIQANAMAAVAHIGEAAVPHLIRALKNKDLRIRQNACGSLGNIGSAARPALPALANLAVGPLDVAGHAESAIRKIVCGAPRR